MIICEEGDNKLIINMTGVHVTRFNHLLHVLAEKEEGEDEEEETKKKKVYNSMSW